MTFLEATLKSIAKLVDFGEPVTNAVDKGDGLSEGALSAQSMQVAARVGDDSDHIVSLDNLAVN
jgi:hypothetical protein